MYYVMPDGVETGAEHFSFRSKSRMPAGYCVRLASPCDCHIPGWSVGYLTHSVTARSAMMDDLLENAGEYRRSHEVTVSRLMEASCILVSIFELTL
jgi:hypothetical protein